MNKLFLISQNKNTGYDTYNAAVVCAPDEETARHINPAVGMTRSEWDRYDNGKYAYKSYDEFVKSIWNDAHAGWVKYPNDVDVEYLGVASDSIEVGLVLASFNAG